MGTGMHENHLTEILDSALRLVPRGAAIAIALLAGVERPLPPGWHDAVRAVLARAAGTTTLTDLETAMYTATATQPDLWSMAGQQDVHVGLARTWFINLRLHAHRQRLADA